MTVCSFAAPPGAVFRQSGEAVDLGAAAMLLGEGTVSLTVMSLPPGHEGALFCQGAELSLFDSFPLSGMESLVFLPAPGAPPCRIELLPSGPPEPQSISLTVVTSDAASPAGDIDAALYAWRWAESRYFSHIAESPAPQ